MYKVLEVQRKHVWKDKAGLIKNDWNVEQTLMKAAADTLHMPPNMQLLFKGGMYGAISSEVLWICFKDELISKLLAFMYDDIKGNTKQKKSLQVAQHQDGCGSIPSALS